MSFYLYGNITRNLYGSNITLVILQPAKIKKKIIFYLFRYSILNAAHRKTPISFLRPIGVLG